MNFINRTNLSPSAFRCVIEGCGAIVSIKFDIKVEF